MSQEKKNPNQPPGKEHSFVQDHKTGLAVAGLVGAVAVAGTGAYMYHQHEEQKKQNESRTRLHINLISAHELLAKDFGGTSDPYIVFKQGHCHVKSSTIKKNLNPVYNQRLEMGILDRKAELLVEAFDADIVRDDSLGKSSYTLHTLTEYPQEVVLKLHGEGGLFHRNHGYIKVQLWINQQQGGNPQQQPYPPPQGYPPQGYPPQGGYPPQSYPPQGYPPQGYPPQGGYPPPGYYPPQSYPPQGYPPQGYPPQGGYPPPGYYPPQSYYSK